MTTQSPLFCKQSVDEHKTKEEDILRFSSVCPNTEYTMKKLKAKKVPEFETIKTLTDDMLYTEYVLLNRNRMDTIDSSNMIYISDIEQKLQTLLSKYNDLPDKSYPFRHTMIIRHEYEKLNNDWMYQITKNMKKMMTKVLAM